MKICNRRISNVVMIEITIGEDARASVDRLDDSFDIRHVRNLHRRCVKTTNVRVHRVLAVGK